MKNINIQTVDAMGGGGGGGVAINDEGSDDIGRQLPCVQQVHGSLRLNIQTRASYSLSAIHVDTYADSWLDSRRFTQVIHPDIGGIKRFLRIIIIRSVH